MRKCSSCGYLLLGEGDSCQHCGAALEVAAAAATAAPTATTTAPAPARAGGPSFAPPSAPPPTPFAPPAPPAPLARPISGFAPPPPPPTPRPATELWQPPTLGAPSVPLPTQRRSLGLGRTLLALLVVVAVVGGYVLVRASQSLPSGTSAFVSGRGVDFTSPDGSFDAQFPVAPTTSSEPVTSGNLTMSVNSAIVSKDDYELGAASMLLPVTVSGTDIDDVLESGLNGGLQKIGTKDVKKTRTTRGGMPALEATLKATDGYDAHALVMLAGGHWMYVLFAHAKTGTDKLFRALDKSFEIRVSN